MGGGPGFSRSPGGADGLLQQAIFALHAQRPQEAERIAALVAKADPRNALALHTLGSALLVQNRAAEAIAPLEAAARGRHDPNIETLLGVALRRSGRTEDALSWLQRASERLPAHAPAFVELGCALAALGRYERAIEVFARGREIAPTMPELSLQLGNVLLRCRNRAEARNAFARAVELAPGLPEALSGLARAHQGVGENEAAVACYRRYLAIRPGDADAWSSLGHCLLELGQRDAGYECFRTAARCNPRRYGTVIGSLVKSPHGRFWLKPSAATRFLQVAGS